MWSTSVSMSGHMSATWREILLPKLIEHAKLMRWEAAVTVKRLVIVAMGKNDECHGNGKLLLLSATTQRF